MKQFTSCLLLAILFQTANAQNWLTTGNAGLTATNFLGTTDNADLIFKTNNTERGKLLKTGAWRLGAGTNYAAIDINGNLSFNGSATYKVGGNKYAFQFSGNTNYGLFFNQTNAQYEFRNGAASPVFIINANTGDAKVNGLTVGRGGSDSTNTVLGYFSFFSNTTGKNNTATGNAALNSNTTGNSNTATGYQALFSNTTGINNTAAGALALSSNGTGINNTASGVNALVLNTSGSYNTASGFTALRSNTNGTSNTASGVQALFSNTSGSGNVASGINALYNNTEGGSNTATGLQALYFNTTGTGNTAAGAQALQNNTFGNFNTAMGFNSGPNADSLANTAALGNAAVTTASNQVRIGNNGVTSIGGYANWTNVSDGRVKKNIKANVPGLIFINKLKPVTYNLDLAAADRIIRAFRGNDAAPLSTDEINARKAKEALVYTGFVAQEVEKAARSLNYDFSGVDAAKNDRDLYGLRYAEFVVPLVKAVQELSAANDAKDLKIARQDQINADLQKQIDELKAIITPGAKQQSSVNNQAPQTSYLPGGGREEASLEQNIPNPFTNNPTINYTLPKQYTSAKIVVTDKSGKVLKGINLSGNGKGSVKIDASTMSPGTYQYSLYVNGNLIDTKQMILAK